MENKLLPLRSSVGGHRLLIESSLVLRTRSYQDHGADGVGGQDVVLQGSAVTLGLHVGGTLVMELEKVEALINNQLVAIKT